MGLDDMGFPVKSNFVLADQILWGILTVVPVIGASCLIVYIGLSCVRILTDIRHKGQSNLPGPVSVKMPVCQFLIYIGRCLLRNHIGAVGKKDGMIIVIVLPILRITL